MTRPGRPPLVPPPASARPGRRTRTETRHRTVTLMLTLMLTLAAGPMGRAQAAAPALGRLFATPDERSQLDALRERGGAPLAPPRQADAPPPAPPPVALDGIVTRSSGKSTVWLNQTAQHDDAHVRRGAARRAPAFSLELPSGQKVLLKPGQRVDPASGAVEENHAP